MGAISEDEQIARLQEQVNREGAIEKATYKDRQRKIREVGSKVNDIKSKHFKHTGSIDARTFMRWEQQSPGFWNDDSSRNKFMKDNPECRVAND